MDAAQGLAGRGWLDRDLTIHAAGRQQSLEYRGTGAARREIAAVPLEDRPAHARAVDLRVAFRGLGTAQLLEATSGLLEQRQRGLLVGIVVLDEPQYADRVEETLLPASLVLPPQRERAHRHGGVDRPRAIGGADHARLAARARAGVARSPGVDQRDAGAAAPEVQGGPAAERPCADHHDVRFLLHGNEPFEERECRARSARLEKRAPGDGPHGKLIRAPRASGTARRTASRSAGGRPGPHGSSQASSGITPSAARAHSMRRTYPSRGGMNVAAANRSHRPDRRTNLPKSSTRNDSTSALCRSVSAAPMPINAARAPMVSEYPRKRSSPVMSSLSGWSRIKPAMRWNVTTESSVATLIPITDGSASRACSVGLSYGTPPAASYR